ncbi:hypothetical protein V6N11_028723 [Hibiscus sabdariffa]|uniref:Centromere protein S n=1 Tax=Hibiscus sabdariffa TaxID=183260 RepID=A0ABR2PQM8_9ROSI
MEVDEDRSDFEKDEEEEDDSVSDLLRDRFRLSAISIAEHEAKRNGMEISQPIVACIADLAFKYIVYRCYYIKNFFELVINNLRVVSANARALDALSLYDNLGFHETENMAYDIEHHRTPLGLAARQLAKDLELFAHHAGRKSVTMADVIVSVSAHRNEQSVPCRGPFRINRVRFSVHRNEHLAATLRSFSDELKAKERQPERKRKKVPRKDDKAIDGIVPIPDL